MPQPHLYSLQGNFSRCIESMPGSANQQLSVGTYLALCA
eukprot:SAG31_NODE_38510_length_295_cov_1.326531_1_plen_38_part_01